MMDVKTITDQFENKTLPKEEWTHPAHIAVALFTLNRHKNFETALDSLREKIKAYNLSTGTENTDTSGYHETLTVFWLTVVQAFNAVNKFENLDDGYHSFIKTLPALSKFPTLFYSRTLLFSTMARHHWIQPDLLPITEITAIIHKNMEQHFILTDQVFEEQFENATLDPTIFTHEAHIRLAWIHISKYGEAKAIKNVTEQLIRYVNALGARDKYNETLTVAAVKAVNHFMQQKNIDNFYDFIVANPRLKYAFRTLMEKHYRFDIYNSLEAKQRYLEPDLLEFT